MTTRPAPTPYFDPYDVEINADPYPAYERLRDEAPTYHNERYDFWALSRHADVEKALVNWQVFSSTRSDILDIIKAGVDLPARRDHVRGPAGPHHAPGPDVPGVHPAPHGPARGPGPGLLRRLPRPPRRLRRLRHHHRAGHDDADAGDRHAPRHPRGGPGRRPRQDRRRPPHRPGPADAGQAGEGRQRRHVRRLHRMAVRRTPPTT